MPGASLNLSRLISEIPLSLENHHAFTNAWSTKLIMDMIIGVVMAHEHMSCRSKARLMIGSRISLTMRLHCGYSMVSAKLLQSCGQSPSDTTATRIAFQGWSRVELILRRE